MEEEDEDEESAAVLEDEGAVLLDGAVDDDGSTLEELDTPDEEEDEEEDTPVELETPVDELLTPVDDDDEDDDEDDDDPGFGTTCSVTVPGATTFAWSVPPDTANVMFESAEVVREGAVKVQVWVSVEGVKERVVVDGEPDELVMSSDTSVS